LIIEDDYRLLAEWKSVLEEAGHNVSTAATATTALKLLNGRINCFIIDLFHVQGDTFLPDGGITIISKIKREYDQQKNPPLIIAVTGYFAKRLSNSISTNEVVQNLGANVILGKPIDPSSLLACIDEWAECLNV